MMQTVGVISIVAVGSILGGYLYERVGRAMKAGGV